MTAPIAALSARFGDRYLRLPDGAERLPSAPLIRPLPGALAPLTGLAAWRGVLLPALVPDAGGDFDPTALLWVYLPGPPASLLGVRDLRPAPPDDEPMPDVLIATAPASAAAPVTAGQPATSRAALKPAAAAISASLRLTFGDGVDVDLPAGQVVRVVPMRPMSPVPGKPDGALGYVNTDAGDALVIDPVWLLGGTASGSHTLLVLFELSGRRLALPCDQVAPAPAGAIDEMPVRLADPALRHALRLAPLSLPRAPEPVPPTRQVLVAEAGGIRFALPADAVSAVLPPRAPTPAPPGAMAGISGMCAHRGDVMPVIDTAWRLGAASPWDPSGAGTDGPLLRLALSPPVALMIDSVPALHRLFEASFTPVGGHDGLLDSITSLDGRPLLVCRPEALAAPRAVGGTA